MTKKLSQSEIAARKKAASEKGDVSSKDQPDKSNADTGKDPKTTKGLTKPTKKTEKVFSTERVRHHYTPEEKADIGERLAQAYTDSELLEKQHGSDKAQMKSETEKAKADIALLAEQLQSGSFMKSIECEVVKYFKAKEVNYISVDTGKIVK